MSKYTIKEFMDGKYKADQAKELKRTEVLIIVAQLGLYLSVLPAIISILGHLDIPVVNPFKYMK